MSSICCCCVKTPKNEHSDDIRYGAFADTSPEPFGHHRVRSINAPQMEAMDPPISSFLTLDTAEPINIESDEVRKLREDLNQANILVVQLTSESGALRAQLDLERRNSIALSRTNKDLTFQREDFSQQLAQLRVESAELSSGVEQLQEELQNSKRACQQQEVGNSEKSREIERLGNKLIGKERDNARLTTELLEIKKHQASSATSSAQSPNRRYSVDERVHLVHSKIPVDQEELAKTKHELEQLRIKHTELTKHLRTIPFLEQKLTEVNEEFSQKVEELQAQIIHWKNKFTALSARNAELTTKLTEAGVKGYGMHHRRSSSLTR